MLLYTFRGIVNKDLTPDVALKIATIEGIHLSQDGFKRILIAGDHRVSTPMLKASLSAGFLSVGLDVVNCGMLPTPVLSAKVKRENIPGVMVTASHNPPEWDYFGEQFASLPVEYVVQSKLEGTASAVMAARDFVDTKFLVVQGDVYASRKLLKEMAEIDSECALSLVKVDDPENHAGVRHQDGQVLETFAENEWVDRGIWLFSPTLFDYIEKTKRSENDEFRMLIAVQKMIDSGVYVSAYLSEGPWIELGDHEPLESVLKAIAFLQKKEEELEDSSIASEIDTQHCSIKNSLIFGEGRIIESRISNSVVYLNGVFKNQHVANEIVVLDKEVRRN